MNKKNGKKAIFCAVMILSFSLYAFSAEWILAVLANNGPQQCVQQWKATADYLTKAIPGETFTLVPKDFAALDKFVGQGTPHFVILNSSYYVNIEEKYGSKSLLTMVYKRQNKMTKDFGGVIFTRKDSPVNTLKDIKGKSFMAVDAQSLGGYHAALHTLLENGIDPSKDCSQLLFGKKHENVVLAIKNGNADVGTVRTDTFEKMIKEGTIKLEEFKIINQVTDNFPFIHSTKLYPEWPLAKTKNTPDEIANKVKEALLKIDSENVALKDAGIAAWGESMDYASVRQLNEILKKAGY